MGDGKKKNPKIGGCAYNWLPHYTSTDQFMIGKKNTIHRDHGEKS
jgi:hypothetical protein